MEAETMNSSSVKKQSCGADLSRQQNNRRIDNGDNDKGTAATTKVEERRLIYPHVRDGRRKNKHSGGKAQME
ncbi:hypothetical protein L195_g041015 [Trifolium pratense]|uniref:Uncharacterized protein n=2 Tax=Trifolium pratense TaxID=57577 RepID=A0A2K3M2F3_TRIPR|nr:hypothetical protein L195_g041015 [Trifolium pratense]